MSDTLRAGLIGLSGISAGRSSPGAQPGWGIRMPSRHAAAYHYVPDTEVVAVCDIVPAAIEKFKADWLAEWPEVHAYADYREMLAKEKLDIVSVATGDHLHAQMVVDAAAAGAKGIICEKPIATTLADSDRMIAAVERARIPMLVDHTRRWMFPWVQAARAIKEGAIGAVLRIEAKEGGSRAMLFRNGTHLIDSLVWMAGGSPKAIYGLTEERFPTYGPRYAGDGGKNPDTDPAVSALVEFDNGVRAFINMCKFTPDFFELDIFGTKGRMLVQEDDVCVTIKSDAYGFQTSRLPRDHYTQGAVAGCVTEMVHLIRHGGAPSSDGREARKTLEIMLGILQSQAKGGVRLVCPLRDA
ncbi:MAG: Gfo/Idh/MocA family oxidoreductase [Actinobacteria bacterium]|nr:Gfo/Idh/MocA family oxidoreductase [Actinomycetota bacterium]